MWRALGGKHERREAKILLEMKTEAALGRRGKGHRRNRTLAVAVTATQTSMTLTESYNLTCMFLVVK